MEKQIEYADRSVKRVIPNTFLKIRELEARGIKFPTGTITKKMLTGVQVTSGYVTPSSKLSEEEYTALRTKIFDDYDRHDRDDKRREEIRQRLENERKLEKIGLCMLNEKKKIIIFIYKIGRLKWAN